jgi:diaminopimelate decarboxylase
VALPLHFRRRVNGVVAGESADVDQLEDGSIRQDADAGEWRALAMEAAMRVGTPCYLSRWEPVLARVVRLEGRFTAPVRSWLSFKTHPVPDLVREWTRTGRGVEVTSEYELTAVTAAGCPTESLLVNGVAKHTWLPRMALPGLRVHFDSEAEVEEMAALAANQRWRVGLRCHVPAEHDHREPEFGGQFGLSAPEVRRATEKLRAAGVAVEGVHFHLGQGVRDPQAYGDSVDYVVEVCRDAAIAPRYIDCGGGLAGDGDADAASRVLEAAFDRARRALPTVEELWLENGRYLTRASAALVLRVVDVKMRPECRYLICDGGRTNQALDADNATHPLFVTPARNGPAVLTTIAGPTCMTDDRLARVPLPESVRRGDLIVWLEAGAYHLPWETRFSQGWCAVAWVGADGELQTARGRETPEAWSTSWRS